MSLPRGRLPDIGVNEIVAAIHRRRERRRASAQQLGAAMAELSKAVERHLARIAELRDTVHRQGGDASHLQQYDELMARLKAELQATERGMADAFRDAAQG